MGAAQSNEHASTPGEYSMSDYTFYMRYHTICAIVIASDSFDLGFQPHLLAQDLTVNRGIKLRAS